MSFAGIARDFTFLFDRFLRFSSCKNLEFGSVVSDIHDIGHNIYHSGLFADIKPKYI